MNFKFLGLFFALSALNIASKDIDINLLIPNKDHIDVQAAKEVLLQNDSLSAQNKTELLKQLDSLKSDLNKRRYKNIGLSLATIAGSVAVLKWSYKELHEIYYIIPDLLNNQIKQAKNLGFQIYDPKDTELRDLYDLGDKSSFSFLSLRFINNKNGKLNFLKNQNNSEAIDKLLNELPNKINNLQHIKFMMHERLQLTEEELKFSSGDAGATYHIIDLDPKFSGLRKFVAHLIPASLVILPIIFKNKISQKAKFMFSGCKQELQKINQIRELINSVKIV